MRVVFIILLLASIGANELVVDVVLCQDNSSLCDTPAENQSEKESKDPTEEESKIDYFTNNQSLNDSFEDSFGSAAGYIPHNLLPPYKEIHSPPPDKC